MSVTNWRLLVPPGTTISSYINYLYDLIENLCSKNQLGLKKGNLLPCSRKSWFSLKYLKRRARHPISYSLERICSTLCHRESDLSSTNGILLRIGHVFNATATSTSTILLSLLSSKTVRLLCVFSSIFSRLPLLLLAERKYCKNLWCRLDIGYLIGGHVS